MEVAGEWKSARELIEDGLRLNPDSAELHNALGYISYNTGLFDEAGDEFKRSLKLNRNYPPALFNRAVWYLSFGDRIGAEKIYERLRKLDREYSDRLFHLLEEK